MPTVTTQIASPAQPPDQSPEDTQYAPPNWDGLALYSIVTQDTTGQTQDQSGNIVLTTSGNGGGASVAGATTMYVFDAMRIAQHEQSVVPTQHPLQTGYNISDTAVLQPARVVLEISMSDAIAEYSTGMWSSNPSKSVSAWQTMKNLMVNRALLTLNTRLETYQDMLLVSMTSSDNQRTFYGLSMILTFQQLILVDTATQTDSARSQTTGDTSLGTIQSQAPNGNIANQFGVAAPGPGQPVIPGAGNYSSNNVTQGGS